MRVATFLLAGLLASCCCNAKKASCRCLPQLSPTDECVIDVEPIETGPMTITSALAPQTGPVSTSAHLCVCPQDAVYIGQHLVPAKTHAVIHVTFGSSPSATICFNGAACTAADYVPLDTVPQLWPTSKNYDSMAIVPTLIPGNPPRMRLLVHQGTDVKGLAIDMHK